MHPPTWLPECSKGTHVIPFGHSEFEVHMVMSVAPHVAAHAVCVKCDAKLAHPAPPRTMVAPGAQHWKLAGQSATGSAQSHSTVPAPVVQVPGGVHCDMPGASQQTSLEGLQ